MELNHYLQILNLLTLLLRTRQLLICLLIMMELILTDQTSSLIIAL